MFSSFNHSNCSCSSHAVQQKGSGDVIWVLTWNVTSKNVSRWKATAASSALLSSTEWEKVAVSLIASSVSHFNKIKIRKPSKLNAHSSATLEKCEFLFANLLFG